MPKNPLVYSNVTVDAIAWTAISTPADCDYFSLFNISAQSVTLRSDPNDANTAKPLAPGMQEVIASAKMRYYNAPPRFPAGTVICWAKADSGTAALVLTCVF